MDSVGVHVSERNSRLPGENRITSLVFPAYTTTLFQAFDLVCFSAMKKDKHSLANEPEPGAAWIQKSRASNAM
jgi:hypothetical protein